MAATASKAIALGTPAPDFSLPDVISGRTVRLGDAPAQQPLMVMFLSRHCPYVQHVKDELARLGRDYRERVAMVGISSNDIVKYPDDAPPRLRAMAEETGFEFPFCYDESQAAAHAYGAACTPEFFIFNSSRKLAYHGQLDGSRPGNGMPVTGAGVRAALEALLAGKPVSATQKPSLGCNIKWK